MTESEKADSWRSLARRTARKVNWGWWVEMLTPMLIVASLLAASGLVLARSLDLDWREHVWIPGTGAGLLLLVCLAAWAMARRHFIGAAEGLVRLEDRLGLKNALTTADHGVGTWPEFPREFSGSPGGLRWKRWRLAAPFLAAAAMMALAAFLPIAAVVGAAKAPPSEPSAWALMDDWAATLEEENLIEESALEEVREKIEELRGQPEDEWFSHGSMEASDNLRDTLNQQIRKLGSDLAMAERDLNALQNYASQLSEEGKERLLGEFDQALQGLAMNGLPLNSELLQALRDLDLKQLAQGQMSQLTPEQLNQLREALKKGGKACGMCNGNGMPGSDQEGEEALAALLAACQMGGRGGIDRGPGEAPMFFGDEEDLKTNNIESVKGRDYSHAAPGDLLATGEAEHDLDKSKVGPRKAGAVESLGQGGEAIWRESLMPAEKAVLKRYFETPEGSR